MSHIAALHHLQPAQHRTHCTQRSLVTVREPLTRTAVLVCQLKQFGPHPASVGTSAEIVSRMGTGYQDYNIGEYIRKYMPSAVLECVPPHPA